MARLFEYRDADLFCHHSLDSSPSPTEFYMHAHERMEVLYFLSGDAEYLVEGSVYPLHPGELLVMNRAEAHKLQLLSDKPYERMVMHFSPSVLSGIDPDGLLLRPFEDKPLGKQNRYVSDRFSALFSDFDVAGSYARIRLHMLLILANVLNEISTLTGSTSAISGEPESVSQQILQYVNQHLFENISLSTVSREFFLSPSQLNRIFRRATGSSVGEYVRVKRLLAARELIITGSSPAYACTACGFQDYSAFYRAYKEKFDVSPSGDRRK